MNTNLLLAGLILYVVSAIVLWFDSRRYYRTFLNATPKLKDVLLIITPVLNTLCMILCIIESLNDNGEKNARAFLGLKK
jgi:hypothetical protein